MNFPPSPGGGGGQLSPPIASKWIVTGLLVFAGAVADRWNPSVRAMIVGPAGFFVLSLCAIAAYQLEFPAAAFAILFMLLNAWAVAASAKQESFQDGPSGSVDWVTNSKRWFVEKVLKERPLAIQAKDVATYPVEGPSAQGSTSSGTT